MTLVTSWILTKIRWILSQCYQKLLSLHLQLHCALRQSDPRRRPIMSIQLKNQYREDRKLLRVSFCFSLNIEGNGMKSIQVYFRNIILISLLFVTMF